MLRRKLLRELRREAGLLAAVVAVIALGVAMFVGSAAGYLDLSTSYLRLEDELRLADLHVDARVDAADARGIASIAGVSAVDRRTVASLPIEVPDGTRLEGRAITLPDSGQPALDQVHLLAGALPGPGQVLVETHLAETFHLSPGDAVVADLGPPGKRRFTVAGVAVSPEYLWVGRDDQDPMPAPTEFGVLWIRRSDARDAARTALAALPPAAGEGQAALAALATAASPTEDSQLLVALDPGADPARIEADIRSKLGDRVRAVTPRDRLLGLRLLQMDVDGLRGMAAFFPVFFLGVATFVFAAVLARLVDAQRPIIGTLLALGVPRRRVFVHYLSFALAIGAVGSVLGAGLGILGGFALTSEYAAELHIPEVASAARPGLWLFGIGLGALAAALAALGPVRRAAQLAPAEAMRPPVPAMGHTLAWMRRLGGLPLSGRLAARGIVRRPVRSVATALGVAVSLVLVLTTSSLVESIALAVRVQAEDAWRYDLRADALAARPAADLTRDVEAIDGVRAVEVALVVPVRISGVGSKESVVQGLEPGARLLRSVDFDGREQLPDPGGIVLPKALARDLHVQPGAEVGVRALPDGPETRVPVSGLSDAALGGTAVMRLADLQALARLPEAANAVVLTADPDRIARVREALFGVPGIARVQDLASLRALVHQFTGLVWAFVGAMLVASVILASAVLYDTATLSIVERRRELATLRTLGRPMRDIALAITAEHAVLALLGLAVGLPASAACARFVVDLYSSDLFAMPFVLSLRTVAVAAVGVVLVLLVAQWPALRTVARLDLAQAVRTREG